jgi:hypothetical protein
MLGALLYLRFTSLKNWLRMRLLRLKQPKYLFGAIVGGAYVWFFFLRRSLPPMVTVNSGTRRRALEQATQALQDAGLAAPDNLTGLGVAIGALALLVAVTLIWVFSLERASLGFTEAEIAFLFPAPATRNMLVQFRLIDTQLRSLVGALVMTLFSNRWMFGGGNAVTHALGWWLLFTAFNLHLTAVRFTLTRLADRGLGTLRRRLLVLIAFVALIAVTVALLPPEQRMMNFAARDGARALGRWIIDLSGSAPLGWVLWPAKRLLGPFFADSVRGFFVALGPALLVIALHYFWVLRSVVSFEEGSITRAEKRSAMVAAMRSGQRLGRAPTKARQPQFKLTGTGRPELAFLWKNLLGTWAWINVRTWTWCAAAIVAVTVWVNAHPEFRWWLIAYGPVALIIGGYTLVAGPQLARQDIRSDLANADLLKTYPLPGWQIVLGELLAPTAILTGVLWLVVLAAAVAFFPGPRTFANLSPALRAFAQGCFSPAARAPLAICVAALVPPVVALQLFVPNAAALVFPAWFQATRQRGGGGIDIMGQRLIFFFVQLLTMLLAILPAFVAGAAAISVACFVFGLPAIVGVWIAATGVFAVLLVELWFGLQFLGARFEKFDLSAELRP